MSIGVVLTASVPLASKYIVSEFLGIQWWLSYRARCLILVKFLLDRGISYLTFLVALLADKGASGARHTGRLAAWSFCESGQHIIYYECSSWLHTSLLVESDCEVVMCQHYFDAEIWAASLKFEAF